MNFSFEEWIYRHVLVGPHQHKPEPEARDDDPMDLVDAELARPPVKKKAKKKKTKTKTAKKKKTKTKKKKKKLALGGVAMDLSDLLPEVKSGIDLGLMQPVTVVTAKPSLRRQRGGAGGSTAPPTAKANAKKPAVAVAVAAVAAGESTAGGGAFALRKTAWVMDEESPPSTRTKSEYFGVSCWRYKGKTTKWHAQININGKKRSKMFPYTDAGEEAAARWYEQR